MAAKNELSVVEHLILDAIQQYGNVDDFVLARQLHCTRTFLVSKLERLWSEGYLVYMPEGYILSDKGKETWIPLTFNKHLSEDDVVPTESAERFDWTAPYIPPAGWMD